MDSCFEMKEIKLQQEKIIAMLNELIESKSQEKIYDAVDLMELLKISKRTLATYKEKGILPYSQVNGKMWVTEAQLKEFLGKFSVQPDKNNQILGYGK